MLLSHPIKHITRRRLISSFFLRIHYPIATHHSFAPQCTGGIRLASTAPGVSRAITTQFTGLAQARGFSGTADRRVNGDGSCKKNKSPSSPKARQKQQKQQAPSREYTEAIKGAPSDTKDIGFISIREVDKEEQQTVPKNIQQNIKQQPSFEKMSEGNSSYEDYYARIEALEKSGHINNGGTVKTVGAASEGAGKRGELRLVSEGETVPEVLRKLEGAVLMSEGKEPWEGVALRWDENGDKGLPDEDEFIELIQAPKGSEVEISDPTEYLSDKQYEQVVDAVCEATEGADIRVYRLKIDNVRSALFVVSREGNGKNARLVGVKALSIES